MRAPARHTQHRHTTHNKYKYKYKCKFRDGILAGFAHAGAATSPDEVFVSKTDNKRADGCLWHPALSPRGMAIDVCIWSDYTLARLPLAASSPGYVLTAAEKFKTGKYTALCNELNLDFGALAANVQGGFGPKLTEYWQLAWAHRIATARTAGLPTRPLASLERRCLESLSAVFARELHRSIYGRTTNRTTTILTMPEDVDGDAHLPMEL